MGCGSMKENRVFDHFFDPSQPPITFFEGCIPITMTVLHCNALELLMLLRYYALQCTLIYYALQGVVT